MRTCVARASVPVLKHTAGAAALLQLPPMQTQALSGMPAPFHAAHLLGLACSQATMSGGTWAAAACWMRMVMSPRGLGRLSLPSKGAAFT